MHRSLYAYFIEELEAHGFSGGTEEIRNIVEIDVVLNTMGLEFWLDHPPGPGQAGVEMNKFRAYRIDQADGKIVAGFKMLSLDDLSVGEVVVKVSHSTINYKDALAATGAGRILRSFPLVGGIDLAR